MTEAPPNSPLPSEAAMFRVVVGVGLALLPVFVLSVTVGAQWAAILLALEIGVAIGVFWRWRGAAGEGSPDS
jgi:hypothetical protein